MADVGGTLIRGADGSLYFVRDEVLEACKVTEDDMAEFCNGLIDEAEDVSGFGMTFGSIQTSVAVQGSFNPAGSSSPLGRLGQSASGTIMCPGVMKSGSIVVNPASQL
ncbi:MAG: hypothetical protein MUF83_14770 [Acidimicrobiales bacterium]|nr:hypothetical protein [Acidimicrobiales bacterium]